MPLQPSQVVWADAAAQRAAIFGRIAGKELIPGQCTRENVEKWMLHLQQRHAAKRTTRWFAKLQPVLTHMSTFEKAITIFTQSDPVVTSLVWGSIKMVLDVSPAPPLPLPSHGTVCSVGSVPGTVCAAAAAVQAWSPP